MWASAGSWTTLAAMFAPRVVGTLALFGLLVVGCRKDERSGPPGPVVSAGAAASPIASTSTSASTSAVPSASTIASTSTSTSMSKAPYSVLFLMIDSLRADMPWAGYRRKIAPWLTKFAERSTLYPRGYALSSYTAKSVVPTLCGKYPSELERNGYFFTKWLEDNVFISERARANGIRTLAGNGHGYFMQPYGLNQGWDDYRLLEGTFLDTKGVSDITSDRLNALAKKMLSDPANTGTKKPFFAYFHFLDPHYTYIKHEEAPDYGDERRDLYDNEVHFTDRWVGDLVDWAQKQPWGKNLAIIITADHGEGMGERGHYRHAYELWESLVRVPLFVYVPGAKARRIELPRSAIDLAPTFAELLGLPPDAEYRGKSLVPEVFGAEAEARPVLADLPRCDLMDKRRALIDGDYKLVIWGDDRKFYLFNVVKDFREREDLSTKEPEKLAEMKALYAKVTAKLVNEPVVGSVPLLGAPPGQRY
jgi:choline-sulfatase